MRTLMENFAALTSIHGLAYIGRRNASLPERLCWVDDRVRNHRLIPKFKAAFLVAGLVSTWLVFSAALISWQDDPTITTLESFDR